MTDASVLEFRRKLLAWRCRNPRSFPWRETDDPLRAFRTICVEHVSVTA